MFLVLRRRKMQQNVCSVAVPWSALLLNQIQTPTAIGFLRIAGPRSDNDVYQILYSSKLERGNKVKTKPSQFRT